MHGNPGFPDLGIQMDWILKNAETRNPGTTCAWERGFGSIHFFLRHATVPRNACMQVMRCSFKIWRQVLEPALPGLCPPACPNVWFIVYAHCYTSIGGYTCRVVATAKVHGCSRGCGVWASPIGSRSLVPRGVNNNGNYAP